MFRITFLFFLQVIILPGICDCQTPANYIPQTPMAAQYEKYINYPVDLSTGAASITVPLYTIKAAGIELPINLSYHTAGVKPSDPSLPVGLGWTINPGARVSRKILGYPDENIPKPPVVKLAEEISPINDIQYLENLEYEGSQNPSSGYTDQYDPEYDIFTYYTGTGVTGKFIIKKQGSEFIAIPLIATRDKIKLYGVGGGIDYFEITDPNGVCYRFGNALTSYFNILVEIGNYTGISAWMLTDIISADKSDTISFKWTNVRNDAGNWYKQQNIIDQVIVTDNFSGANINPNGDQNGAGGAPGYTDIPQRISQLSESYVLSNVIEGIRYKDKEVKFVYTGGVPTKLERMEVYSNSVRFRKVDFHKSLFGSSSYFRLDSVSIRDKNDLVVNRYRFGYNESSSFPVIWPHRQLDFWGYYNGQEGSYLLPNFAYEISPYSSQPYFYSFGTASRGSSSTYAQAYILNSVVYPTGGKTTYEYESNMFKANGGSPTPAGGLRVKKISHWAADGQLAETRSYQYGTDGGGDGSPMEAMWYAKTSWICSVFDVLGQVLEFPMYRKMVISSEPNETIFIYEYPSVTYRTVTEYIGDANGSNSGKIVYNYSQAQLLPLHSFLYSHEAYGYWGRYWDNPRLEKTTYFKYNQGSYTPVHYTSTIYNTPTVDIVKSLIVRRHVYFTNISDSYVEQHFNQFWPNLPTVFQYGTVYFNYGGPVPSITRDVEITESGESIATVQNYEYDNNDFRYVKSVTTQNSNGNTSTTHYTYPPDYNVGSSPTNPVAQGIKLLQDRNVVAPVIEEYTEVQPGNVINSGKFTAYKTDNPVPENVFSLNTVSSAASFNPATITSSSHTKSGSYNLRTTINLYDGFGNVRQATDEVGGISTVILYSYNGQYPIAVIKNSTFSSVASALGGETVINNFASTHPSDASVNSFLASIRTALPSAFITTYTHDLVFGMTSQTDENSRTTYYEYDAFGRLQLIKDKDHNVIKTFEYKYKQ